MQAKNMKSLFHFLTEQMEKLSKGEITVDEVKAQALLAKQVTSIMRYELDRAIAQMKLNEHNQNYKKVEFREVESTAFDNTNFNAGRPVIGI